MIIAEKLLEAYKDLKHDVLYGLMARGTTARRSLFLEKNGMDFRFLTLKQINDLSRAAIKLSKAGVDIEVVIENIKRYYAILNRL